MDGAQYQHMGMPVLQTRKAIHSASKTLFMMHGVASLVHTQWEAANWLARVMMLVVHIQGCFKSVLSCAHHTTAEIIADLGGGHVEHCVKLTLLYQPFHGFATVASAMEHGIYRLPTHHVQT